MPPVTRGAGRIRLGITHDHLWVVGKGTHVRGGVSCWWQVFSLVSKCEIKCAEFSNYKPGSLQKYVCGGGSGEGDSATRS